MEFIPYIVAVLVLFLVLKILALPMKLIMKFIINAIIRWSNNLCTWLFRNRNNYYMAKSSNSRCTGNTRSNHSPNNAICI